MRAAVIALLVTLSMSRATTEGPSDACKRLWLGLTVSSFLHAASPRCVCLHWEDAVVHEGDWVAIFMGEPPARLQIDALPPAAAAAAVHAPAGVVCTSTGAPVTNSSTLGFEARCVHAWAAYVRDNTTVLADTCLRTEPTWMSDNREHVSALSLQDMFLPGTHDSGAWELYSPGKPNTMVRKYSITQEEDILAQLIYGIRYIDVRVGYYSKSTELWWLNHGPIRLRPLQSLVDSVVTFVNRTGEVVVLDVQEFPIGFGSGWSIHGRLINYLQQQLGPLLADPSLGWRASMGEVWEGGAPLILAYEHSQAVARSTILWPAVQQKWGNVQAVGDLYAFLNTLAGRPSSGGPTAAMAELTPTAWLVLSSTGNGLREMAQAVNANVTRWYRRDWGRTANVVAVDFFRGSGVVQVAITWNQRRAQNVTCLP